MLAMLAVAVASPLVGAALAHTITRTWNLLTKG